MKFEYLHFFVAVDGVVFKINVERTVAGRQGCRRWEDVTIFAPFSPDLIPLLLIPLLFWMPVILQIFLTAFLTPVKQLNDYDWTSDYFPQSTHHIAANSSIYIYSLHK